MAQVAGGYETEARRRVDSSSSGGVSALPAEAAGILPLGFSGA